jgi:ATP-dependent DNA helicase RecG
MIFESEKVEFKLQATDEIYKEVVAFANTDGGTIYIGIDDQGNAVGLENVDETYTRITNGIRDAILPDVTLFVRFTLQDNRVIKIDVSEGSFKPYYLKSKGLKPSGVLIRQGASSAPASFEQIRRMIKESDGDVFEKMRSMNQELTFENAKVSFARYGVEFSESKYRTLGIIDKSGTAFTNLALLLSDQCEHTTKIAVFADEFKTQFKDSKEFGGSVLRQMEDAFSYLMLCNQHPAELKGLRRVEHPDYPEEALREALLNAIVHRDYSFSGSIIINVNDTETEFISIGGLLPGLSTEDIRSGISQPRNQNLAEIFHRLHLIESYGTGIRRIYYLYKDCSAQPRIEVTPNAFKIVLPNLNHAGITADEISPQEQQILDFIAANGSANDADIQNLLHIKPTRTFAIMKQMREKGLVKQEGRGAEKRFYI